MKKGFTLVEMTFLLIIVISFSIIILRTDTGATVIQRTPTMQDFNGSIAP